MSTSTDGILVYGLSFEEGALDVTALGEYLEFKPEMSEYYVKGAKLHGTGELDVYDLGKPLKKLGLAVTHHCHCEYPMYILGCGETTASRGYPVLIKELPQPNEKQAEALAAIKKKLGGKLGVWLCSYLG